MLYTRAIISHFWTGLLPGSGSSPPDRAGRDPHRLDRTLRPIKRGFDGARGMLHGCLNMVDVSNGVLCSQKDTKRHFEEPY
ncbi:hypothetical protein PSPO01_13529 [Paraphaeosphaeria sporulosa]